MQLLEKVDSDFRVNGRDGWTEQKNVSKCHQLIVAVVKRSKVKGPDWPVVDVIDPKVQQSVSIPAVETVGLIFSNPQI